MPAPTPAEESGPAVEPVRDPVVLREMVAASRAFELSALVIRGFSLQQLKTIRETRAYQALGHSWESFCSDVLRKARRTVDDDIQNMDTLGEQFLQIAADLRIGRRALHVLRGIPEDARPKLLPSGAWDIGGRVIDPAQKDQLQEVLEELVAQQRELQAQLREQQQMLREQVDGAQAEVAKNKADLQVAERKIAQLQSMGDPLSQPVDKLFATAWFALREVVRLINEEAPGTEPERIRRWVQHCDYEWRELIKYFSGWQPMTDLPEGHDPAKVKEVLEMLADED